MFKWFKKPVNKNIINVGDKVFFHDIAMRDYNNLSKGTVVEIKRDMNEIFTQYAIKREDGNMTMKTGYDVFKDNE